MEGILDLLDESAPDAGVEDSLADVSADDEVRVVSEDDVSDEDKPILEFIKDTLKSEIYDVKLSKKLGEHPVCLSTEGEVSLEMEKVFSSLPEGDPNAQNVKAKKILEINSNHKIFEKIKSMYNNDKDALKEIAEVLLTEAKLMEGLPVDDMGRFVELATKYIAE